jgi:hypothetical protein
MPAETKANRLRLTIDRSTYLVQVRMSLHEATALHLAARLMATRINPITEIDQKPLPAWERGLKRDLLRPQPGGCESLPAWEYRLHLPSRRGSRQPVTAASARTHPSPGIHANK